MSLMSVSTRVVLITVLYQPEWIQVYWLVYFQILSSDTDTFIKYKELRDSLMCHSLVDNMVTSSVNTNLFNGVQFRLKKNPIYFTWWGVDA